MFGAIHKLMDEKILQRVVEASADDVLKPHTPEVQKQRRDEVLAKVFSDEGLATVLDDIMVMDVNVRGKPGEVLQSDIYDSIKGYYADSGLEDIAVALYKDDEALSIIQTAEEVFRNKVLATIKAKGYRIIFDWDSGVIESKADDILKPHSPETLAYREEAYRQKRAQFTKIYSNRSKVKQAGPITGLSSGDDLPASQGLTGTIYYNMDDKIITTITIDVDKFTLGGITDWQGEPRNSLNLTYIMGKDLEDYEEFVSEWAPASTNEANADDLLQPHSPEALSQKKEERWQKMQPFIKVHLPNLEQQLKDYIDREIPADPEQWAGGAASLTFLITANAHNIRTTKIKISTEVHQQAYWAAFDLIVNAAILYAKEKYPKWADLPRGHVVTDEAKADDLLQPHSPEVQQHMKDAALKKAMAILNDEAKANVIDMMQNSVEYAEILLDPEADGNDIMDALFDIAKDVGIYGPAAEDDMYFELLGDFLTDAYNEVADVDESKADDLLQPHSKDIQQQRKEEQKKRLAEIANKYFPHLKEELLTWLEDKVVSPMPNPDDPETMDDEFWNTMFNKAWALLPPAPEGMDDAADALYDEAFYLTIEDVQTIYYNKLHEDKADDVLKPHTPEVRQQKKDALMQRYYDQGMQKDIKAGDKIKAYGSVLTNKGYFHEHITFIVKYTSLFSTGEPYLRGTYSYYKEGEELRHTVSSPATWTELHIERYETIWGWSIGQVDTLMGNNYGIKPVVEDRADDVLKPHPPEVVAQRKAEVEQKALDIQAERFPTMRQDLIKYVKSPEYIDDLNDYMKHPASKDAGWYDAVHDILNDVGWEYVGARGVLGGGVLVDELGELISADIFSVYDYYKDKIVTDESGKTAIRILEDKADDVLQPHSEEVLRAKEFKYHKRLDDVEAKYLPNVRDLAIKYVESGEFKKDVAEREEEAAERFGITSSFSVLSDEIWRLVGNIRTLDFDIDIVYDAKERILNDVWKEYVKGYTADESKANDILQPHSEEVQKEKINKLLKKYTELGDREVHAGFTNNLMVKARQIWNKYYWTDGVVSRWNSSWSFHQHVASAATNLIADHTGLTANEIVPAVFDIVNFLDDSRVLFINEAKSDADKVLQPHSQEVMKQKKKKRNAWLKSTYEDKEFPDLYDKLKEYSKVYIGSDNEDLTPVRIRNILNAHGHEVVGSFFKFAGGDFSDDIIDAYYAMLRRLFNDIGIPEDMSESKADDVLQPHSEDVLKQKRQEQIEKNVALLKKFDDKDLRQVPGTAYALNTGVTLTDLKAHSTIFPAEMSHTPMIVVQIEGYSKAKRYYQIDNYRFFEDMWELDESSNESKADDILQPHSPEAKKEKLKQLRKRYAELEQKYLPDFRRDLITYAKSFDYEDDCLVYQERRGENRWRVLQNKADELANVIKWSMPFDYNLINSLDDVVLYTTQLVFDKYVIGVPRNESKVQEATADDILKPFTDEEKEQRDEAKLDREMDAAMAASADAMPEVLKQVTSEEFLVELFSYDEVPGDVTNWLHDRVDYITGGRPQNIDQGLWDDEVAYFIANLMEEFAIDLSKGLKKQFNIVDESFDIADGVLQPHTKDGFHLKREVPMHEIEDILTNDVADQLLRAMSSGEYFQLLFDTNYLEDPLRGVLVDKTEIPDEIEDTHWFWEGHMESEVEGFVPYFIEAVKQALGPTKYQGEEQPSFDFTEAMADDILQPHSEEVQQQKKAELVKRISDGIYKAYGVRPDDKVKQVSPINRAAYTGVEGMTGTIEQIPSSDCAEIQIRLDPLYPPKVSATTARYMVINPLIYPIMVGAGVHYYVDEFKKEWASIDVREDKADDVLKPHTPEVKQRKEKERFERIAQDIDRVFPNIDLAQKMLNYANSIASWADYRRTEGPITTIFIDKAIKIVGGSKKWKALRGKQENFSQILWSLIEYLIDVFDKRHTDSSGAYRIGEAKADDVLKPHSPEVKQQKLEIGFREIVGYASSAVFKFIQSQFADVKDGIKWFEADGPPYTMIGKYTDSYIAYHESPVIVSFDEVYDMVWRAVKQKAGLNEAKSADDILQPFSKDEQYVKYLRQKKRQDVIIKKYYPNIRRDMERYILDKNGLHHDWKHSFKPLSVILHNKATELVKPYPEGMTTEEKSEYMDVLFDISAEAYNAVSNYTQNTPRGGVLTINLGGVIHTVGESNADDILQPHSEEVKQQKKLEVKKRREVFKDKYEGKYIMQIDDINYDRTVYPNSMELVGRLHLVNYVATDYIMMQVRLIGTPMHTRAPTHFYYNEDEIDQFERQWRLMSERDKEFYGITEDKADDILKPHSDKIQKQRKAEAQKKYKAFADKYENKDVMQIADIRYADTLYPDSAELTGNVTLVSFGGQLGFLTQIVITGGKQPVFMYYNEEDISKFEFEWRLMSERDKEFYDIAEDRTADDVLQPHSPEHKQRIADIQLEREREWHKAHNGKHVTQIGDIDRDGLFTFAADFGLTGIIGFEVARLPVQSYIMFVQPDEALEELNEWGNRLYYYDDEYDLFKEEWELDE